MGPACPREPGSVSGRLSSSRDFPRWQHRAGPSASAGPALRGLSQARAPGWWRCHGPQQPRPLDQRHPPAPEPPGGCTWGLGIPEKS